jgi:hypothetical protein
VTTRQQVRQEIAAAIEHRMTWPSLHWPNGYVPVDVALAVVRGPEFASPVVAERDRARDLAVAMEQQLADLAELHESWGNTDPDDLDQLLLWEDFDRVLNRAVTE